MFIPNSFSIYLILTSQALLLGALCIALSRFQRQCRKIEQFWDSPTGLALAERELEQSEQQQIVNKQTEREMLEKMKLEQRVTTIQRQLHDIKAQKLETNSPVPVEIERSLPIENALRMAKQGASIEDLTRNCGLNVGEARLLQKLHGKEATQQTHG